MDNSWVSIKRRFLSPGQTEEGQENGSEPVAEKTAESDGEVSAAPAPSAAPRQSVITGEILDATGRQSEMIRVGMGQVMERLDEIARLKEDFNSLVIEPISELITDYPFVQAKLLETEELLH